MKFGDLIDSALLPIAPRLAVRRMTARIAAEQIRGFDAASRGRRTQGWKRPQTSADRENEGARAVLSASSHDLVRNNKYAAAGLRQMTAAAWGDGIAPMITHPEPAIASAAQSAWDRWAEGRVAGQNDWYGHGRLCVRGLYGAGESLTLWRPDGSGPDGRVMGLEGDYLDEGRIMVAAGARIVQGVEFDADGERSAYWLFRQHPGDLTFTGSRQSERIPAQHVDHLFEALRHGQTRGISRLAPLMMTLRDIADIEDARRLKEKVAACVALIIQPGEGESGSPLTNEVATQGDDRPDVETLRPGMITRLKRGETATSLIPAASADGTDFIRQQLAAVSASMVPYHVLTGDVSQANYSGLRAALLTQWGLLDDDQQNVIIPLMCQPALDRRMRRLALETGDRRFLDVRAKWALPVRRHADPVKDLLAEVIEIRSGLKLLAKALAERGINATDHLNEIAALNVQIDQLGLALETDPRRLTDSGVLQAATGYLAPKPATAD